MARKKRKPATMPDMMSLSPGELHALEERTDEAIAGIAGLIPESLRKYGMAEAMTGIALQLAAAKDPPNAKMYELAATRAGHKAAMALADYAMKIKPWKDKP